MSKITVCLDCPCYRKGGYCTHKRKDVAALNPACEHALTLNNKFNPEDEEAPMQKANCDDQSRLPTTKKCERCGEVLPFDAFEWRNHKGTMKRMHICSKCYHAAMKKRRPEVPEGMKQCNSCGEIKLLTEFYKDANASDGVKSNCKACHKALVSKTQKERRAKRHEELQAKTETAPKTVVVREVMTDDQLVMELRARGWDVTCKRTITQEL